MKTNQVPPTLTDLLSLRPLLRVSFDESGRERSNEEQLDEIQVAVDRNPSWVLSSLPAYRDVGSASRYAKKRRENFDALIADLRNDTFHDDGLVIWEGSRASRQVDEWLLLVRLLAERGKVLVVTTHGPRLYEPGNHRDWKAIMEDAIDVEYESRKTSARVGRSMIATAQQGTVPPGQRMFGYNADGMSINAAEAAMIREAVRKVLAGTTTRQICKAWNAAGVTTTAGNPWHPSVVRGLLRNPRLAALRVHRGKVVGKGVWPSIIDETEHRRLAAVLAVTPRAARGKSPWVLTGFLRCGVCGRTLVGAVDSKSHHTGAMFDNDGPTRRYTCRKAVGYHGCGSVSIRATETEELIGLLISERVINTDKRRRGGNDADELAELDSIAADRIELADLKTAKRISTETWLEQAAALDRRQRDIERVLASKVTKTASLDLVAAEGLIGRPWSDLDVDQQRMVIGAVIDRVTIAPATVKGSKRYEPGRVQITWKA